MGMAVILVMRPGLFIYTMILLSSRYFMYNLALTGRAVSEEKIFEIVDGRTSEHGYTVSSPRELKGSSDLKWTPGAHLSPTWGNIHVCYHNIQTSSPMKPLGQSKPNFS